MHWRYWKPIKYRSKSIRRAFDWSVTANTMLRHWHCWSNIGVINEMITPSYLACSATNTQRIVSWQSIDQRQDESLLSLYSHWTGHETFSSHSLPSRSYWSWCVLRMYQCIWDFTEDMHKKACKWLHCLVLVSAFNSAQIVKKGERNLHFKAARAMFHWSRSISWSTVIQKPRTLRLTNDRDGREFYEYDRRTMRRVEQSIGGHQKHSTVFDAPSMEIVMSKARASQHCISVKGCF